MESCASLTTENELAQQQPQQQQIQQMKPSKISFSNSVNHVQQQQQHVPTDLQYTADNDETPTTAEDWLGINLLRNFIGQQKQRDAELNSQKTANSTLQQRNAALMAELESLSQTKAKMERENLNLGEYGFSLQTQINNLRNLPIMISQSRNRTSSMVIGSGSVVNGSVYVAKSPQSGESIQGDATSSPSTYCESSITSPMTLHGNNGLMSPPTPNGMTTSTLGGNGSLMSPHMTVVTNGMPQHQLGNPFPTLNYQASNGVVIGESIATKQQHSPFGGLTGHNIQRTHSVAAAKNPPSQLHFQASNCLSSRWSTN